MDEKKKDTIIKVSVAILAVWFIVGCTLEMLPKPFFEECEEKCSAEGHPNVLGSSAELCRCYNNIDRTEIYIMSSGEILTDREYRGEKDERFLDLDFCN